MSRLMAIFAAVVLTVALIQFSGCSADNTDDSARKENQSVVTAENAKTVQVKVTGMTCQGCVKNVETALADCDGVISGKVNLAEGSAEVTYDPAKTDKEKILTAISSSGYEASSM